MKPRSSTQALKATRIFTDREEPRAAFWKKYNALKEQLSNDPDISVITYYGIGGIGKSSLLRKLEKEMTEQLSSPCFVHHDFNISIESKSVLEKLATKLTSEYKFTFPLFELGCYVYAKKTGDKSDAPEAKQIIEKSGFLKTIFSVADVIPVLGIAAKILEIADTSIADIRTYLKQHARELKQIEFMETEELYKNLPLLFARDMEHNTSKISEPVVVFLDTYECVVNELSQIGEPLKNDEWIKGENGIVQNIPGVLWVIAGREKLKWEMFDPDWSEAIEQHLLGDLSPADSIKFLSDSGVSIAALREQLYKLTGGTPLYLDICVDRYNKIVEAGETPDITMFGKNTYDLIERFVRYMGDTQKDLVYVMACMKKWNDELMAEIGSSALPDFSITAYEKTKTLSFVIEADDGSYFIHQTVGEVLMKNCPELIMRKVGEKLIEKFEKIVSEKNYSDSEAYSTSLEYTLSGGMLVYKNDEELREFFTNSLFEKIWEFAVSGSPENVSTVYDMLEKRTEETSNTRLCAEIIFNLSRFESIKGFYQKAYSLSKKSFELYLKLLDTEHPDTISAMNNVACMLFYLGKYDEANITYEKVLDLRTKVLGAEHLKTISAMNNLANTLDYLGKLEEALVLKEKVLELRTKILGTEHQSTVSAMNNLACTLNDLGRYEEAKSLREKVLEMRTNTLGESHLKTISALSNLANTLDSLGIYNEALSLKEKVLEQRTKILGTEHPSTISSMNNLACTLDDLGRHEDAKAMYEKVLELRTKLLGEEHPDTISAIHNLSITLENMNEHEESLALENKVFELRTKVFGREHPDTVNSINSIAFTLDSLGKYEEAKNLYEQVLELRTKIFGEKHPETISAINNLAITLTNMKKHDEALELKEKVLQMRTEILGEDHPDTINAMSSLAYTYEFQEKYIQALELREKVVELKTKLLGEEHPDTIRAMGCLAYTLDDVEEYEEAKAVYEKVLEFRTKTLGEEHTDTINTINNLAITLENSEKYEEALVLKKKVLELRTRTLGAEHSSTISAMINLANTLDHLKQYEEALVLKEKILELKTKLLGADHHSTISAMSDIAYTLDDMQRYEESKVLYEKILEQRLKTLGEANQKTLHIMTRLAMALKKTGDSDKAYELLSIIKKHLDI